jgi:hypothetical protein
MTLMSDNPPSNGDHHPEEGNDESLAGNRGFARDFFEFLKYNKKWWLTPIAIVTVLLIGAALLLPSPVAPFIYTLF